MRKSDFWTFVKNTVLLAYSRFLRIRVVCFGPVHPPLSRPFVVVANHVTGADSLVIQIALRTRLFFLSSSRWFVSAVGGFVMRRACDCLAVDPQTPVANIPGIRQALRLLAAGNSIGVYPSGRLEPHGWSGTVKNGAAWLALHSGAEILPVVVQNLRRGPLPYSLPWLNEAWEGLFSFFANLFNGRIAVLVGSPIRPDAPAAAPADRQRQLSRLNDCIRREFARLFELARRL